MRTNRARGRIFREAKALSKRRFLHRSDLPGDGIPCNDVPGIVRYSADIGLERSVAGDAARCRTKKFAATPGVSRVRSAQLRAARAPQLGQSLARGKVCVWPPPKRLASRDPSG